MPKGIYPRKSLQERFWANVNITNFFDCWQWLGYREPLGYGRLHIKGQRPFAHRLSYLINIGPIPNGLQINHKCNNPSCVNPYHLYAGTQKENIADMFNANRQACQVGEKGNNAKLTEKQVVEIIRLLNTDMTHKEIADRFSTSRANITSINTGNSWKYIPR